MYRTFLQLRSHNPSGSYETPLSPDLPTPTQDQPCVSNVDLMDDFFHISQWVLSSCAYNSYRRYYRNLPNRGAERDSKVKYDTME